MCSERRGFITLALAGEVMIDEIDDFVDHWHEQPMDIELHDYLGMTCDEYALWLQSPDFLPLIVASRRLSKPLQEVANDNLREMRLAARATDTLNVKRIQAWLEHVQA